VLSEQKLPGYGFPLSVIGHAVWLYMPDHDRRSFLRTVLQSWKAVMQQVA